MKLRYDFLIDLDQREFSFGGDALAFLKFGEELLLSIDNNRLHLDLTQGRLDMSFSPGQFPSLGMLDAHTERCGLAKEDRQNVIEEFASDHNR